MKGKIGGMYVTRMENSL